jgi:8-oxo-dGTP diphosphatase
MRLRTMAGAFVIKDKDYLMMKRSERRSIASGMWAPVGGHVEPIELNDPKAACLREIYEESGIEEKDFESLDLKYIIFRRCKDEIRLHYIFIGVVKTKYYEDKTEEGKLLWIREDELIDRPMTFTIRKALENYLEHGKYSTEINVGTVSLVDNIPKITWNLLDNWESVTGI